MRAAVRETLAAARQRLAQGEPTPPPPTLVGDTMALLARREAAAYPEVLNATGVLIHTNLGRAPRVPADAPGYLALEYNLGTGARGERLAPVVDRLVTGLPVAQAQDPRRREALRRALLGRHVTERGAVEVNEVRIVPQPVGAFVDLLWADLGADTLGRIEEGTVLVLDAGFYSFDWAVIVAGELRRGASGTSLEAMSVLLERAAVRIAEQHGGRPQPLALEAALRQGREHVRVLGQRVPLKPSLERAAREVGGVALEALRQALRREATNVDLVVVTGGGGDLYGRQAAALFPGAEVRLARDPVGANARGFFHYARR